MNTFPVIPAKAGIPLFPHPFGLTQRDPRLRGGDELGGSS